MYIDKIKGRMGLYLSSIIFLLFYLLICLVNHFNFRTNWFDLGFYTNHLYHYSHFDPAHLRSALGDHFDLLLLLFSPFQYLFGSITLLLIQAFFILWGGRGIYLNAMDILRNERIALFAQITFCFSFGVLSAVAFDYHSNVIAACLVPYLFHYYRNENKKGFLLIFFLILLSKENMMLWLAFILSALPFIEKKHAELKRLSLVLSVISLACFYVISSIVMPKLAGVQGYPNFKYTSVGGSHSFSEVFLFLIQHPIDSFRLLFVNTSGNVLYDYYKAEAHIFILLAGGMLLFIRPLYLWMLIPIYLQKFLHDSESMWGVAYQYNIEFIPIILIMLLDVSKKLSTEKVRNYFLGIFCVFNLILSIRLMDHTETFMKHSAIRIYQAGHYTSDYDVKAVNFLMDQIPREASVTALTVFTPHLAQRNTIKMYKGGMTDTDYILLANSNDTYPLDKNQFEIEFNSLLRNRAYRLKMAFKDLYLFEKVLK